jgi:hypothetical protein
MKVLFGNNRLADVRENYEKSIVQRFLENYVCGLRDCELQNCIEPEKEIPT